MLYGITGMKGELMIAQTKMLLRLSATADVQEITPIDAVRLLEGVQKNRSVSTAHVAKLARAMKAGQWHYNGASIVISATGNVLDGQHRLWACIEADTPFTTLVARGVPDEAFNSLGEQRARTSGDNFAYHGVPYAKQVSAIASMVWLWQHGRLAIMGGQLQVSKDEAWAIYQTHPEIADGIPIVASLRARLPNQVAGFCYYAFGTKDRARRDVFFDRLINGTGLESSMAVYQLKRRLDTALSSGKRLDKVDQLALTIKAWNHADRPVGILRFINTEDFPEILG